MPTVGVYVPMHVARAVAMQWETSVKDPEFPELIRGIVAAALDKEGQVRYTPQPKKADCQYARFHVEARRCRHCGGV